MLMNYKKTNAKNNNAMQDSDILYGMSKTALSEPECSIMQMRACFFFPPVSQSMLAFFSNVNFAR